MAIIGPQKGAQRLTEASNPQTFATRRFFRVDYLCRRNFGLLAWKSGIGSKFAFFSTNIKSINWLELGWKKWFLRSFLKSSFVDFENILKKCYFSFSLGSKQYNNVSTHSKLTFLGIVPFGHADYLATPFFWTEKFGPRDMARLWCLGPSEKWRPSARVGHQMSAKWKSGQVKKRPTGKSGQVEKVA